MRVLVTGASGFVGGRLCPALVAAGHEVRAMTRRPDRCNGPGEAVYRDVSEPDSLDVPTGRSLIDSMTDEVVVRDQSIRTLVPFEPVDYDTAVAQALDERSRARYR